MKKVVRLAAMAFAVMALATACNQKAENTDTVAPDTTVAVEAVIDTVVEEPVEEIAEPVAEVKKAPAQKKAEEPKSTGEKKENLTTKDGKANVAIQKVDNPDSKADRKKIMLKDKRIQTQKVNNDKGDTK